MLTFAAARWQMWLWLIGGLVLVAWGISLFVTWQRFQHERLDPVWLILEELLRQFSRPIVLVSGSSLVIIVLGFSAGSQVSMILFVMISGLTISGAGLLGWYFWPRDIAQSNLFDSLPLPHLSWPSYEDQRDQRARAWVQTRVKALKEEAPPFEGALFGTLALEVSQTLAKHYEKKNPLSVTVSDTLTGLERTAADLKILSNHLPLTGHLTLAEFERQIDFTMRSGRFLYSTLFLVLSVVNPGNLLRAALVFTQKKSPWEHILRELQGWVYAHYVERLGFHMSLIYSGRKPPPIGALQEEIDEQHRAQVAALRRRKLGLLGSISLFGTAVYLGLQILNAGLVFGIPVLLGHGFLLVGLFSGVAQMREGHRWQAFWEAMLPSWPEQTPPEGPRERRARNEIALVMLEHKAPPEGPGMEALKQLPAYYGDLLYQIWMACCQVYHRSDDPNIYRAARELYLPQGFAGIELLCRDLRDWYESDTLLPRLTRLVEQRGFGLEAVYAYFQKRSRNHARSIEDPQDTDPPAQIANIEEPLPETPASENNFWKGLFQQIGGALKGFALKQLHQRLARLISQELGERFIQIYGARFPKETFLLPVVESQNVLLLLREADACIPVFQALLGEGFTPPQDLALAQQEALLLHTLTSPSQESRHFYAQLWSEPTWEVFSPDPLVTSVTRRAYQSVLLLEPIDYGARGRVARFLRTRLIPNLRQGQVGALAVVLYGVEKLKPLRWEPPYDEYRQEEPHSRKAQRIRNAVLAWQGAFQELHALPFSRLFPVGIPAEGRPWGTRPVLKLLELPPILHTPKRPTPTTPDDLPEETNAPESTEATPEVPQTSPNAQETEPQSATKASNEANTTDASQREPQADEAPKPRAQAKPILALPPASQATLETASHTSEDDATVEKDTTTPEEAENQAQPDESPEALEVDEAPSTQKEDAIGIPEALQEPVQRHEESEEAAPPEASDTPAKPQAPEEDEIVDALIVDAQLLKPK